MMYIVYDLVTARWTVVLLVVNISESFQLDCNPFRGAPFNMTNAGLQGE